MKDPFSAITQVIKTNAGMSYGMPVFCNPQAREAWKYLPKEGKAGKGK